MGRLYFDQPLHAVASCVSVDGLSLENDYDVFLERDVSGKLWLLVPQPSESCQLLEHYLRCKQKAPLSTSAYVLLPQVPSPAWARLTRGMSALRTFSIKSIFSGDLSVSNGLPQVDFVLYYDPPRAPAGVYNVTQLPNSIRGMRRADCPPHTFVFTGKAAGLHTTFLWDPGATLSYLDASFVKRNHIAVTPSNAAPILANGDTGNVVGIAKVSVAIQQHRATVQFQVMDLAPGIDCIPWRRLV